MHLASSCLSLLVAVSLLQAPVQAQERSGEPSQPTSNEAPPTSERTTERPPPTSSSPATTDPPTTTTTPIVTTTTPAPVTTTSVVTTTVPPVTSDPVSSTQRPTHTAVPTNTSFNPLPPSSSTSISFGPQPTDKGTSSSSSTNVPAIVGSIVGILALVIVVATSVVCYRRRRRNNRELTFDALHGMSGPGGSSKNRASNNYLTGASPIMSGGGIGLSSMTTGGYEDGYNDYDMQSTAGYPTPHHAHNIAYSHGGYDDYATSSPHQGHLNPTIFQEDAAAAQYATASSMGVGSEGFDQNLPELMYNGAGGVDQAGGYYNESDLYDANWHHDGQHHDIQEPGGYVGAAGLWVANPEDQYQQQEAHSDVDYQVYAPASAAAASATAALSAMKAREGPTSAPLSLDTTVVASDRSAASKHTSFGNPQALPDSPILQSGTLRGGDLFGPDGDMIIAPVLKDPNTSGSPRSLNSRELKSIDLSRQTAGSKPSGEGANSYAADYGSRPSTDGKTLRTLRPEEWS